MPLFQITSNKLENIEQSNFDSEKELQALIESNVMAAFNCRLSMKRKSWNYRGPRDVGRNVHVFRYNRPGTKNGKLTFSATHECAKIVCHVAQRVSLDGTA